MSFQKGNSKLGKQIWTFSIPAGSTCPGKTDACSKECYAAKGFFLMKNVKKALVDNVKNAESGVFVDWAVTQLTYFKVKVCRVHVSGDLYSKEYADNWLAIFKALPKCRFFIYTRSWRIDDIRPVIEQMAKLKNVRLWYSTDKETGKPSKLPKNARIAYMQTTEDDVPSYKPHVVFRVDRLRDKVVKYVNNGLVCPVENGITENITCVKCGHCWRDKGEIFDWGPASKRTALPVLN